jgi:outer membrane protein TolC
MPMKHLLSHSSKYFFLPALLLPAPALATQPLDDFISGAREQGFDAREQRATARQRDWEAEAAKGRLLPSLSARGSLTHNQFQASIPAGTFPNQNQDLVIQPQNQLEATFQLDVPLIDLSAYARHAQAKHLAKAAEIGVEATGAEIDRAVSQAYFTYLGAEALLEASQRTLEIAQENFDYVKARAEFGAATQLDQQRASANVEQARQDQADAKLLRITAARNLETLSGISPTPVTDFPVDDLSAEEPLESWLRQTDTPQDRVQEELTKAAAASRRAAGRAMLPSLSAMGQERITNATGFTGQNSNYTISAMLTWRFDYNLYSTHRSQEAAQDVQAVRAEKTRRSMEDIVFNAYHRVEASIAKSRSARAQAEAARKAADISLERYKVGAVTQLDVTQSQRDAFAAQANRIKADADLAHARVLLRIAVGKPAEATSFSLVPRDELTGGHPPKSNVSDAPAEQTPPPAQPAPAEGPPPEPAPPSAAP